jgi:hypothetical protein
MEIFCFCEGMSSFELPVSKIRVELSILTLTFRQVYCLVVFTLEQKTFLIESYFRDGLKMNGSWIYSVQNCFEDNLSRCVKLFRETGGVYRRKTTGQPLKRTAAVSAVIE